MISEESLRAKVNKVFIVVDDQSQKGQMQGHLTHRKLMYLIRALEEGEETIGSVLQDETIRSGLELETATRAFEQRQAFPGLYEQTSDDREIPIYDLEDCYQICGAVLGVTN